ncbi:MAG: phosphoribosylformylglycinamidine cyclo-ligase [Chloroflexi bacterium]|nr:phosphoribosylformylglycinamidine cyclo-ligase [Chloroflexota bacterium]
MGYAQAGVDIEAGNEAVRMMKKAIQRTYSPQVLSGVGHFGGLFDAALLAKMDQPVLVASTDGVGTKTMVAAKLDRWDTIGQDLVNHCINDILVQGARPLFFLDYVASSKLNPEQMAQIVGGMAAACQAAHCAILGGETAEMPGVYQSGQVDLVGTIIGAVDRAQVITGETIQPGDLLIGLPSSGLHTNGYSLARLALKELDWNEPRADLHDQSIGDALLAIHTSYLEPVSRLLDAGLEVKGLAHITGGGLIDNLPRILPKGCTAQIDTESWARPPIFDLIRQQGGINEAELWRVFNMGTGMVVELSPESLEEASKRVDESYLIGEIVKGDQQVILE